MKTNEDRSAHVHDNGSLFGLVLMVLVEDFLNQARPKLRFGGRSKLNVAKLKLQTSCTSFNILRQADDNR